MPGRARSTYTGLILAQRGMVRMPSSHHEQIPKIVWFSCLLRPEKVLDAGFGFGKYGFLLREYLEVPLGRYDPADWRVRIDGIEAYAPYVHELQRAIYDTIHIGDALAILKKMPAAAYDLILAIDVLEHFTKEDGGAFIAECRRVGANTLISTPIEPMRQEAWYGNEFETHRSKWTVQEMLDHGARFFVADSASLIAMF